MIRRERRPERFEDDEQQRKLRCEGEAARESEAGYGEAFSEFASHHTLLIRGFTST